MVFHGLRGSSRSLNLVFRFDCLGVNVIAPCDRKALQIILSERDLLGRKYSSELVVA